MCNKCCPNAYITPPSIFIVEKKLLLFNCKIVFVLIVFYAALNSISAISHRFLSKSPVLPV